MIDLTNKTVEEINGLIQKYTSVLELIEEQERIPYLAYIIDIAVNHIKNAHSDLTIDWKAWCIVVLTKLFSKIKKEGNISEIIDDFVAHYKKEYQNYCDDLALFASEYDRDYGFCYRYVLKKNR